MENINRNTDADFSEDVQEIIGQTPKWIVRWGIAIFGAILLCLAIGTYLFKYPIVVSAPFSLTTVNPPTPLLAKSSGRIMKWFVKDKDSVRKGEVVALLENTSSFSDIKRLKDFASQVSGNWEADIAKLAPPENLELGQISGSYASFRKSFLNFKHYLSMDLIGSKMLLTEAKIKNQESHVGIGRKQWKLKNEEFALAKEKFKLDSISYARGYGMTKQDYNQALQSFISAKSSVLTMEGTLKNADLLLLELKESLAELALTKENEIKEFSQQLDEAFMSLTLQVEDWHSSYAFIAPIDGKVTLTNYWSENQTIGAGERLATVVPENETIIIARSYIPASALGRVEIGQNVNIKLSGFPYLQYGILRGRIKSISMVPEKEGYVAEISLEDGMTSTYRENLKFTHQMDGVADIITDDSRLIYRFVNFRMFEDH